MADTELDKPRQTPQPRPMSTTSSQLSFSDRIDMDDGGGDADNDDNSSLRSNPLATSTCSSSLNLQRQSSNASQSNKDPGTTTTPSTAMLTKHGVNGSASTLVAKTTTISTIAMESNTSATSKCSPTRLVIALLQTPHQALHLKIIELSPNLLKLPDNLPEAEDYLKNHSQVIKNLQSKQSPVEELLRQADSLIATQKPRAEVYAAMADSLGQTWKDLNAILDERRIVLELTFNCHKVIQACVERMNAVHSEYSKFNYVPTIEENLFQTTAPQDVVSSLRKLKVDRADVLKHVSQALDVCQQLLNKITDFNFSIDSRQLFLKRDVDYATKQVNRWLERLHDRRMILEEKLKMKREQFEEMADFLVHDKEMSGLLRELDKLRKASDEFSLGHSVDSAEKQRDALDTLVRDMKMLQERCLLTARKLEQDQQKGKFYQRSGLKQKIYEILGTVNDLITESIDFELSLVDAKEFFHLAETANEKLDELASSEETTRTVLKSQINSLTYDALSKGQILLDSLGWDSPRTGGVRQVYDELSKRSFSIQEEIDHLELLDEYNHFLESVNQAYQNLLSVESSILRQPKTVPAQRPAVVDFHSDHERTMDTLSHATNFKQLLSRLEEIYPGLSEEEKMSTEEKVNQLKSLSNVVVETILQRIWLSGEWLKILELDESEWSAFDKNEEMFEDSDRVDKIVSNLKSLYGPIQEQLSEVHRSDPDLITSTMEESMEALIRKYRNRQQELGTVRKIRDICHAYKVKLDHHLLGMPSSELESRSGLVSPDDLSAVPKPSYFPVLNDSDVATTLRAEELTSTALEIILRDQLQAKLNSTLTNFFQPLITDFRQEIFEAQQALGSPLSDKTPEEVSWERYFERLKESYVKVTKELEGYLGELQEVCIQVNDRIDKVNVNTRGGQASVEVIEEELTKLTEFRGSLQRTMDQDLKRRMEHVLAVIGHEEPPIEAEKEKRTLHTLSSNIIHGELDTVSQTQDTITRQLTEKMIHSDLDMINRTLNELISELEHPCNYGNNLKDAQTYLASFERFEKTVETLRDKLSRLLTTAGMSDTDVKAQNLLGKLNLLVDRKGKRRELILLSLEYFKLIEKSNEHYEDVNREIDDIIAHSKAPDIKVDDIERLLKKLDYLRQKEGEQEKRLDEIERISKIIFDTSQEEEIRQHYPLRDQSARTVGEIRRVETDLTNLLGAIRSQSAPALRVPSPSPFEEEIEEQIVVQQKKPKMFKKALLPEPEEIVEEEPVVIATRPKSQEMCTQTSTMDEDELDEKTREYLKEKERMTVAVLEALRQSMSPLPPPQTVEKETQFEEVEEEVRTTERLERDTVTQTIIERLRSFETQTEFAVRKGVEIWTETDEMELSYDALLQRPASREYLDPMFIQPLKDLVVNEGDKVVLECKTTGRISKLIWLKDGLEIVNNPDYKTDFLDGSTARLTIDEALHEDSAVFTCRAFGEGDNVMVETSGRLTIREPVTSVLVAPQFLPHPPVSVGDHGKSHSIQLKVEGNPLPTVQWFKDGHCIDTSPDYVITFNNGLCQIQFDDLIRGMDDGVYSCIATNKLGECETKVEVQIKGDVDASKKLSRQPPRIVKPLPKNLMSRAGQKVKLDCEFESPTDFTVVWIKDDNKILTKANSSAEITTQGGTSTLVFNEAYPVNSGKYSVLIRNIGGECQSDCQIVVKGLLPAETSDSELNISDGEAIKPSVKMPLKDARARVGDSLRLDCVIVGNPEPEVIWFKNAIPLKESPNHHLLFHGDKCSLVVDTTDLSDNGIYSVSAINNCGEASSKCQVFVFEKSPEVFEAKPIQPPIFTKIIQDEMVTAGKELCFVVEVAPDPENPDLVLEVTWWKSNTQITPSERIEITKDGYTHTLRFPEVDLSDRGNYMVKATNPSGDSKCFGCLIVKENFEKATTAVPLLDQVIPPQKDVVEKPVEPPPQPRKLSIPKPLSKAPRFVVPLEGRMVDEGERNVALKCVVDAFPSATIKWTKNNRVEGLQSSPDLTISHNEKTGEVELVYTVVSVKDGGRYTCHASNEHGMASSVSDLVVKKTTFPPVFSKRLQSVTVDEGKRIYLEVDVFGKPAPDIQWNFNGQPLMSSASDGVAMRSDTPTRHSLIISDCKPDAHGGDYKVIAKNEAGEAVSSCTVNVIGKPVQVLKAPSPIRRVPSPIESFIIPETSGTRVELKTTPASTNLSVSQHSDSGIHDTSTSIIESTTTTVITSTEEHYESRVTRVISPVPPTTDMPSLTSTSQPPPEPVVTVDPGPTLVPGPEPEILVAPLPAAWSKSKNQVLQKVKKFEEESVEVKEEIESKGGVRIIPISKSAPSSSPKPQLPPPQKIEFVEAPRIAPSFPAVVSPIPFEPYLMMEPPKVSYDASFSVSKDSYTMDDTFVQTEERHQEQRSARDVRYIRPSKFVPEKMRESDYESEVESTVIPPKWIPPPVAPTTSAFVPLTTTPFQPMVIPQTTMSSTTVEPHTVPSRVKAESSGVKGIAKLWPPSSPTVETTQSTFTAIQKESTSEMHTLKSPIPTGGSRLSPILAYDRARSPTPNKEALDMDKLWSKPIRFSSPVPPPTISSQAPIPQPVTPVSSPSSTLRRPEVPPKPASSWLKRSTPKPYSPVTSPLPPSPGGGMKPEVPPKPSYLRGATPYSPQPSPLPTSRPLSSASGGDPLYREPTYFVSTVSTPRTTPVPAQLGWTSPISSTPEVPPEMHSSSYSTFHEKCEFFETTSTSYSTFEETSTSQKQFSSSSTKSQSMKSSDVHPSGISLLDLSLLPPPGEPPVFMYAPPPAKPSSAKSIPITSSTSKTQQASSSSTTQPQPAKQPEKPNAKVDDVVSKKIWSSTTRDLSSLMMRSVDEIVQTSSDQNACTSLVPLVSVPTKVTLRRHDAPYIRPTKFVPVLDYFSSSDREAATSDQESGGIRSKWKPGEEEDQSKWRRVTYDVPPSRKTRRDSLGALVDKSMQEMNKQFKTNIGQFSQGLCYNRLDRKIQSDLGGSPHLPGEDGPSTAVAVVGKARGEQVEDSNPLIYFKYDFGYEFGIASPRTVRASSEPPAKALPGTSRSTKTSSRRPTSMVNSLGGDGDDDDTPIELPIIHETTGSQQK